MDFEVSNLFHLHLPCHWFNWVPVHVASNFASRQDLCGLSIVRLLTILQTLGFTGSLSLTHQLRQPGL